MAEQLHRLGSLKKWINLSFDLALHEGLAKCGIR